MGMVGVAQLVEHLVVIQDVAGSSPVTHPNRWTDSLKSHPVRCRDRSAVETGLGGTSLKMCLPW